MPKKKSRGQPTKYKTEYNEIARKLALLGKTDVEIAEILGVSEKTLNNWKKNHAEFFQSLRAGKDISDGEVANSLYERAIGYVHDDLHITTHLGKVKKTKVKKHYPPDTQAGMFWLCNRQRDKWSKAPSVEDDPGLATPVQINVNVVDASNGKSDS
ncbi:MAG: hypothetical protein ACRBCK_10055 [Alphaproteobacteria bacterium]